MTFFSFVSWPHPFMARTHRKKSPKRVMKTIPWARARKTTILGR